MARVLMPLPSQDFDPSEAAVSWQVLTERGHHVVFATPDGLSAVADELMLTGHGLDIWGNLPGLRRIAAVGRLLRANAAARAAYAAMERAAPFKTPSIWGDPHLAYADALLLPGGHRARGMHAYLQDTSLQQLVARFFAARKPVAAICHGVLLAARSLNPETGLSVLHGRRTTALTWQLEKKAIDVGRICRYWDPHYYHTYPDGPGQPRGYMSVQQEVTRALASPQDFCDVPRGAPHYLCKTAGLRRDSPTDNRPAFVVRDGHYVSARWPGDAHTFAQVFAGVLDEATNRG